MLSPNTQGAADVPHTCAGSHIFTRAGSWRGVIESDTRSLAAAEEMGVLNAYYLHSLDYIGYARLQLARDEPVRAALERRDWAAAAAVEPRVQRKLPWDKYP